MSRTLEQFERVKRFLKCIENQNKVSLDYDDELWAFFQNCWHLKDFIKYDSTLHSSITSRVETNVKKIPSICICADLCNRSKHSNLTKHIRKDARVAHKNVTIKLGNGEPVISYEHIIVLKDGSKYNALDVARNAVEEWEKLLKGYGLIK